MGWVREGACPPERCQGRCCSHLGVWFDDRPEVQPYLELVQARGVRVVEVGLEDGRRYLVDFEQRCRYLTEDNLCALHPDMKPAPGLPPRPRVCNDWPQEPAQTVLDACGYTFRWEPEPSEVGTTNG